MESKGDCQFHAGNSLKRGHCYEDAIAAYDAAISLDPNHSEAFRERGMVLAEMGRYEDAIASIAQAIAINPANFVAVYQKEKLTQTVERLANVVAALQAEVSLHCQDSKVFVSYGIALEQIGRFENAIDAFDKATILNPSDATIFFKKAMLLKSIGKFAEANDTIDKAINLKPNDATAFRFKGAVLEKLGRLEDALEALDVSIVLEPQNSETYSKKGNVLSAMRRPEDAINAYDQAIALNDDLVTSNLKGLVLEQMGRWEEALDSYENGDPNYPNYFFRKGVVFHNLGRLYLYDALLSFEAEISRNPSHGAAFYSKGTVLVDMERFDEAVSAFEKAIALDPSMPDLWSRMALALEEIGRFEEAFHALEREISLNPCAMLFLNKGLLLEKLGRMQEALSAYDEAISLDPDDCALPLYNKGDVLDRLGRFEDAIETFDRSISLDPKDPDFVLGKGDALDHLARYGESLECFFVAMMLYSSSDDIRLILDRIQGRMDEYSTQDNIGERRLQLIERLESVQTRYETLEQQDISDPLMMEALSALSTARRTAFAEICGESRCGSDEKESLNDSEPSVTAFHLCADAVEFCNNALNDLKQLKEVKENIYLYEYVVEVTSLMKKCYFSEFHCSANSPNMGEVADFQAMNEMIGRVEGGLAKVEINSWFSHEFVRDGMMLATFLKVVEDSSKAEEIQEHQINQLVINTIKRKGGRVSPQKKLAVIDSAMFLANLISHSSVIAEKLQGKSLSQQVQELASVALKRF
eukprot:TRINITY_DN5857_c0_g7_i1.p1 TRINITY_DN5857_c0_g7~~TRINITY_DN5857_c0_g7_i1.p1  ORF type:complete len:757 (-),score=188.96 TRINITY_DN5857_c0_g7_i1:610-2880(-)